MTEEEIHYEGADGPYCGARSTDTTDEIGETTCRDCLQSIAYDVKEQLGRLP